MLRMTGSASKQKRCAVSSNVQSRLGWYEALLPAETPCIISTAATTPAVGARSQAVVEALANSIIINPPFGMDSSEFQFLLNGDGKTATLDVFASRGIISELAAFTAPDHFSRIATVALVCGLQPYSGIWYFADTVTVTNSYWLGSVIGYPTVGSDYIGELLLGTSGYRAFAFVCTAISGSTQIRIRHSGFCG